VVGEERLGDGLAVNKLSFTLRVMSPASLRILRRWETVAGVTRRMETSSRDVIWPAAEIA